MKPRPISIVVKCILVVVLAVLIALSVRSKIENSKKFDYSAVLDETAYTLDGENVTFGDLAYFIARQESLMEEEAKVYNRKNTRDFWNAHANGVFISVAGKNAVRDTSVHDILMYNLAVEEGLSLSEEQEAEVENVILDFWMDLQDGQKEKLLTFTTEEEVRQRIYNKALAEVYQDELAKAGNHAYVYYDSDGEGYEKILKEHELTINKKLWKKMVLGNITISHGAASYINGYDPGEKEDETGKK